MRRHRWENRGWFLRGIVAAALLAVAFLAGFETCRREMRGRGIPVRQLDRFERFDGWRVQRGIQGGHVSLILEAPREAFDER